MAERPPFKPGSTYNTQLDPLTELLFRGWVGKNNVPFNVDAPVSDYDMRGFYKAQQQQNPMALSALNANDGLMHYPDYWKTPLHQSFSNESQWGMASAPQWVNDSQLAAPNGRVVFDEKARDTGLLGGLMGLGQEYLKRGGR
jgi:hypothetical protein